MAGLDPQVLADRVAIRDLVDAYARAVDRFDGAAAAACFTPDGVLAVFRGGEQAPVSERTGREAIARAIDGLTRYDVTLHVVANHYVALDGVTAEGETYCLAHHVHATDDGGRADFVMAIRYLDRFRHLGEGWRIERRELHVEFTEDRPANR